MKDVNVFPNQSDYICVILQLNWYVGKRSCKELELAMNVGTSVKL